MKKGLPVIFFLIMIAGDFLFAQEEPVTRKEEIHLGSITLIQDTRIREVVDRQTILNKRKNGIEGYRIQIFFNSGRDAREEAIRVKADFLSLFPDLPVYIVYRSPFYKVRAGNFRNKYEALGVFRNVRRKYPAAYIVKDIIPFPELD